MNAKDKLFKDLLLKSDNFKGKNTQLNQIYNQDIYCDGSTVEYLCKLTPNADECQYLKILKT